MQTTFFSGPFRVSPFLACAALLGSGLGVSSAFAQDDGSPGASYSAETLKKNGAATLAEGLSYLPGTEIDWFSSPGSARVNLLGLGARNTLTLINGRRAFGFSDLNAIPFAAVGRVDVSKAGASPLYGSDGAGGVVNVVLLNGPGTLKTTGTEIDLFYATDTRGGSYRQASVISGFANDKLSIVFGASYSSGGGFNFSDRVLAPRTGYLSSPRVERRQVYSAVEYQLTDNPSMRVYGDVLATDSRVGSSSYTSRIDVRSTRVSAGIRGDIPIRNSIIAGLSYDIGGSFEENKLEGDISRSPAPTARRSR